MKLTALALAAAATALAPAAFAQTANTAANTTANSTTTTSTTTSSGRAASVTTVGSAPGAVNAAPETMQSAPGGMNTTGGTDTAGAPTSGGAFQPLPATSSQDIVATLQASGEFGTFLKVADATGLTQVLKTTQGITVFAPTDQAFAAVPPAAMDLKDAATVQKLQKLLTYHIVNTTVPPLAGHSATSVATVAGPKVTLDGSGPHVKINDANALETQVTASNGVIYPIDKVLSPDYVPPPAAAPAPEPAAPTKKKTTKKRHTS